MVTDFPSTLALDHVVVGVGDLAQTMCDYRALGFTVLEGGQHPGRTSHNALVVFADGAYLELIAWRAPAPDERWFRTQVADGDGLVDFALLPNDTQAVLAAARARGLLTLTGPLEGGRVRPDGECLKWQSARHSTPDLPFLCGDITPRSLRVPEGDVRWHVNGALGVVGLSVAVLDLDSSLSRYTALLGRSGFETYIDAGIRHATIELGSFCIQLLSPLADSDSFSANALKKRLTSRGEGPCALNLCAAQGNSSRHLDPSLTHGVEVQLGV
ncbi:MAG: VOC family protein [Burkholderiaceae bacterium]